MMLIRKWITAYLGLCLVGGAAVSLSPTLHHWVEHGGHGVPHIHASPQLPGRTGALPAERPHGHGDGHPHHSHTHSTPARVLPALAHHQFDPPWVSAQRLWKALWLALESDASAQTTPAGDDHEHHTLFQLLAAGLVDSDWVTHLVPLVPHGSFPGVPGPTHLLPSQGWDAQTAPRGPPNLPG